MGAAAFAPDPAIALLDRLPADLDAAGVTPTNLNLLATAIDLGADEDLTVQAVELWHERERRDAA